MINTKKVTINDVALKANVSKKTVSRVINQETGVNTKTRQHVLDVIQSLNYAPDPQARGLATKRSSLFALIFDNPNPDFVTESMYGVLQSCQSQGYELIVHPFDRQDASCVEKIVGFIRRMKIEGVIILPPLSESIAVIQAIKEIQCQYICITPTSTDSHQNLVCFDNERAVQEVIKHLALLGHKHIGFIKGAQKSISAGERYSSYCQSIKEHAIAYNPAFVKQGNYTFSSGLHCGKELLEQSPRPTAIFASNDEMALGVMAAANSLGLKIPNDVAIVGFDDTPHASEIIPSLTTVNLHIREMGNLASEKLMLLCNGKQELALELPYRVTSEFIQRESTSNEITS